MAKIFPQITWRFCLVDEEDVEGDVEGEDSESSDSDEPTHWSFASYDYISLEYDLGNTFFW